jgi:hypothetical protein
MMAKKNPDFHAIIIMTACPQLFTPLLILLYCSTLSYQRPCIQHVLSPTMFMLAACGSIV